MFLLALAHRKNFYNASFLQLLSPDGVVFDAASFSQADLPGFGATAARLQTDVYVDPVNQFDQSPIAARPRLYRQLPYGARPRLTTRIAAATLDRYVEPIVAYQLRHDPSAVIAPYFYAEPTSMNWVQASLDAADSASTIVARRRPGIDVWAGVAIAGSVLSTPSSRATLLAQLEARTPATVYLLVSATQATAAPLADVNVIEGMIETINTVNAYGGRVIAARRYVSGFLARSVGAAGWTTGISGTHQNLAPPPLGRSSGGQGVDWIFVPPLLNSVRMTTRAALVASDPTVVAPRDQYEVALFRGAATRTTISTGQRILMHQHNLVALRDLDSDLARRPPGQRRAAAKLMVRRAKATYTAIQRGWLPGERPGFLDVWDNAL